MRIRNNKDMILKDIATGDILCGIHTRMIESDNRIGIVKVAKGLYIFSRYPNDLKIPKSGTMVTVRIKHIGKSKIEGVIQEVGKKKNVIV